jgi:hypothetical protein
MDRNMKPAPAESQDPGLPDAEIDEALDEAIASAMRGGDETLLEMVRPSLVGSGAIPDWVPENIQDIANLFVRRALNRFYGPFGGSVLAMVDRLTCDPQMEAVWTQLLQKSRTTGGFRLAANLMTMVGRKRADEIHPASTTVVFRDAITFGLDCLQFAEQKSTHYLEQAQKLRSDARSLERALTERRLKNLSPRDVHGIAKKFDDAADGYRLLADLVGVRSRPTDPQPSDSDWFRQLAELVGVNPRPTDPQPFDSDSFIELDDVVPDEIALTSQRLFEKQMFAKRFALNMAATMQALFAAGAMYGTVATITRVALDDDEITGHMVRDWWAKEEASRGSGNNEKLIAQLAMWRHGIEID